MSVLKETSWLTIGVLLFSFVCLLFGTSDRWWPPLRELVKEYIPWLGSGMTNRGRRAGYKFPPHEIRELRASVEGCRSALTVPDNGSFAATQEAYRKFDEIRVALIGEPQLDKLMNKFNGLYSRFVGLRRRIEDLPNNPDHWGQHRDREIDRMYGLEDDLGDEIFIAANDLMRETEWILD